MRRGRCLDKLRRDPVIAALINAEVASAEGELQRALHADGIHPLPPRD
jgi:hypothetical protein